MRRVLLLERGQTKIKHNPKMEFHRIENKGYIDREVVSKNTAKNI